MISEECEHCRDKVFIRKQWDGLKLCLDCLNEAKLGHRTIVIDKKDQSSTKEYNVRRCIDCGRIIPEDARICPYCQRHYW